MFLISILGLLSMSTGLLHKSKQIDQTKCIPLTLIDAIDDMTLLEVRRSIDPLIFSHSVYSVASVLSQASPEIVKEILHDLFTKPNPLTRDEKIVLLLLVAQSQKNKKERYALFDMALKYPELQKGTPILKLAAQIKETGVLKAILDWLAYRKRQGDYEDLKNWVKVGLQQSLSDNDFSAFKRLLDQPIRISMDFASILLVRAIQENRDVRFIPLLIKKGVKPNYVGPNNRTLLMEAVLKKNIGMVEALLNLGADPNFITDPEIGSAIQLAYERGYIDLELLMRRWVEDKKDQTSSALAQ